MLWELCTAYVTVGGFFSVGRQNELLGLSQVIAREFC